MKVEEFKTTNIFKDIQRLATEWCVARNTVPKPLSAINLYRKEWKSYKTLIHELLGEEFDIFFYSDSVIVMSVESDDVLFDIPLENETSKTNEAIIRLRKCCDTFLNSYGCDNRVEVITNSYYSGHREKKISVILYINDELIATFCEIINW